MKKTISGSLIPTVIVILVGVIGVIGVVAISQGTQRPIQKHTQIATPGGSNVTFAADNIQRQEQLMQLKGNVEISMHDLALHADDVAYNEKTGEIEARGIVRIRLETQN